MTHFGYASSNNECAIDYDHEENAEKENIPIENISNVAI